MTTKQAAAIVRLVAAAKKAVKVYPWDWKACLAEKQPCKMCACIAELDAAIKGVKL